MPNRSNEKKRSALKGGFGWIVDMTEDISPPPATIKKEGKSNDLSSMVGLHIEISNRFIRDIETVIWYMNWINAKYITV